MSWSGLRAKKLIALALISSVILFSGIAIGYCSADALRDVLGELKRFFGPLQGLPPHLLAVAIFANNFSKTLLFAVLLGVMIAIPPALFALLNGVIIGLVGRLTIEEKGLLFLMAGILPHGVFEIPALLLSCALGIEIGMTVCQKALGRDVSLKDTMIACLKTYLKIVVPLLLVAALVEAYVTPLVVHALL
jgi:stage II sporulation protein M